MTRIVTRSLIAAALLGLAGLAQAQGTATDKAFVAKVSQGGMYEVVASQYAVDHAQAQDVKDQAIAEVHDHSLVGDRLKEVSTAAGITFPADLNAEFQTRLSKLKATSASGFDAAYITDMKQIHDKDQKLFAQESTAGSAGFRPFAHETDLIVKRHIGALHGTDR